MANYKSFVHVLRLDNSKIDVESFLNGTVYVFPKLDGTNACAWATEYGEIRCGSRKREISVDHDNADFNLFFISDKSTKKLRDFLIENPNLIVYGEWLNGWSGRKQAGTIKQYLNPGFWIFGVFDIEAGNYLNYDIYASLLEGIYDKIDKPLAVINNPSYDDIVNLLSKNHFNLPDDTLGEGVVCWNYDFLDKFGKFQVTKIVAKEFLEKKGTSKKIQDNISDNDIESLIVEAFVSSADCEKCKQKVITACGLDEWTGSGKEIGMFLTLLYSDLIQEEMYSIIKRFRNPTINFSVLKKLVFERGRKYLGLI